MFTGVVDVLRSLYDGYGVFILLLERFAGR